MGVHPPPETTLMFAHAFVRNAYLAGTLIGLACGTTGWFVVLRAQVFAADALSHVAFVKAIAAAVVGLDARVGLFLLTLVLAGALTALGRRGQVDDVPIGITFAWVLGIGVLLIEILARSSHGASGITTVNTLFGSIYALSGGASLLAAAHHLTAHPLRGLVVSGSLAVLAVWIGLALSYVIPSLPPSTAIIGVAAASYAIAVVTTRARLRSG